MSGRRSGRLLGSLLLVLAAVAIVGWHAGVHDDVTEGYKATDIIWTIGTESAVIDSVR
ncbi:hypothetical protein AB0869_02055 [Micromonospora vinacea]|uniref:hypothetical protein n=1 Tax=Micromonospora vinacea TaxID=709878 RepID=UPI00345129F6